MMLQPLAGSVKPELSGMLDATGGAAQTAVPAACAEAQAHWKL